jgi:hypothetical protein
MSRQIGNLILGIIFLGIALVNLGVSISHGTFGLRTIALDGSLMLFAVCRFMMFGAPGLPLIKPLRTIALIGVVASYLLPRS